MFSLGLAYENFKKFSESTERLRVSQLSPCCVTTYYFISKLTISRRSCIRQPTIQWPTAPIRSARFDRMEGRELKCAKVRYSGLMLYVRGCGHRVNTVMPFVYLVVKYKYCTCIVCHTETWEGWKVRTSLPKELAHRLLVLSVSARQKSRCSPLD
jgi:hypothetical protein